MILIYIPIGILLNVFLYFFAHDPILIPLLLPNHFHYLGESNNLTILWLFHIKVNPLFFHTDFVSGKIVDKEKVSRKMIFNVSFCKTYYKRTF